MTLIEDAQRALDGVQDDPTRALVEAREVLGSSQADPQALVVATWAVGRAYQELGHADDACAALEEAARAARDSGDVQTEARIAVSLSWPLVTTGRTSDGFAALRLATDRLVGAERARAIAQRGLLQLHLGRIDAAFVSFNEALPGVRASGDLLDEARLLINRAAAGTTLGHARQAEADLIRAADLADELGQQLLLAGAEHNLGYLYGRLGDVPDALHHFDQAARAYSALDNPRRLLLVLGNDRCEVLLDAGLTAEARALASEIVASIEREGDAGVDEARLLLARACLAGDDLSGAIDAADAAASSFTAAGRNTWAALARYVGIQAEMRRREDAGRPPARMLADTQRLAHRLEVEGWRVEAAHVRTFSGRLALALDRPDVARTELPAMSELRYRGTAELRSQAWHATALLRLAEGDRGGARRAIRRGLAVVDAHQASLGASELRARAAAHGTELARLGLRLALADAKAADVLTWAERHRARSMWLPAVRPSADPELAATLIELREARTRQREAILGGGGGAAAGTDAQIAALERAVQQRSRLARGEATEATDHLDLRGLRRASRRVTIVELLTIEGMLHAVVVANGRVHLHGLGRIAPIIEEKDHLLSAMRRFLTRAVRSLDVTAAQRAYEAAARRVDHALFDGLGLEPDTPVAFVPSGALHGLPWSAIPTLAARPTTVAPSAALWQRPDPGVRPRRRRRSRALLAAGPGLPGADDEVRALAVGYPGSTVLAGEAATTAAVLEAMRHNDVAHLAAHGTFRADNPGFSAIGLVDGPLTVYDLESLDSTPRLVVLPACSAAALDVHAGDELLGTTAALLSRGVRSVVAPVLAVPDLATTRYSVALHDGLRAGDGVAVAVHRTATALRATGDPTDRLVADAFVCFGSDEVPSADVSA